jgi:hypothetical protein
MVAMKSPFKFIGWFAAMIAAALVLLWVAIANGFPLLFSDSGGYFQVGTELHYLSDRPIVYGLMIAPFARIGGPWAIVVAQALLTASLIGAVVLVILRRSPPAMTFLILAGLALCSSLPWFVGQVMPDLLTGPVALLIFLIFFGKCPEAPWQRWWPPLLLVPSIAVHLSHLPIAVVEIFTGYLVASWRRVPSAGMRAFQAATALMLAVLGLCSLNLIGAHRFVPSLESNKFLLARLFDGHVAQPVLDKACQSETLRLCAVRARMDDPRRLQPGQDYLWAGNIRATLASQDVDGLRMEEGAFVWRVVGERPFAVGHLAIEGIGAQIVHSRAADGMTRYSSGMQAARQVRIHFPSWEPAFQASREQKNTLQALALMPDRLVALIVALLSPLIMIRAIRRGDNAMVGLVAIVLTTVITNAAVCGILSGPADRYESRVLWLLPLLGLITMASLSFPTKMSEQLWGPGRKTM